jgi:hypothetical protein
MPPPTPQAIRPAEPADPRPDRGAELAARVARARAEATTQLRRSRILLAARELATGRPLLTRCAWCDRYALAGEWLEAGETPAFVRNRGPDGMTHGICPSCLDPLIHPG